MSRTALIQAELGGEDRDFRLAIGELMELEEKRDCGAAVVLARLSLGQWLVRDVIVTIRLGLIGAGMDSASATRLVRTHVEQKAYDFGGENGLVILAVKILAASLHGAPDEPLGKAAGEIGNGSTISQTAKPDSATSSALAS